MHHRPSCQPSCGEDNADHPPLDDICNGGFCLRQDYTDILNLLDLEPYSFQNPRHHYNVHIEDKGWSHTNHPRAFAGRAVGELGLG